MLDEAQTCLKSEVFAVDSFDLISRGILIKIIFDRYTQTGADHDFLLSQLHAYEKYVSVKKLSPEKKNAQLHWIRFLRKMTALKFEYVRVPETQKEKLRERLAELQPMVNKRWALQRIATL